MSKYKRGSPRHDQWLERRGIKRQSYLTRSASIVAAYTRMSAILPTTKVDVLRVQSVNGFNITVNRFNDDDTDLQVFINDTFTDSYMLDYISMEELDEYIKRNTGR